MAIFTMTALRITATLDCHARGKADIHVAGQARDAHKHGNPPQHDGVHVKSR